MWVRGEDVELLPKSCLRRGCGRKKIEVVDVLKEKAKRVGVVAEEGGMEVRPGRRERWQWKVSKRSRGGR